MPFDERRRLCHAGMAITGFRGFAAASSGYNRSSLANKQPRRRSREDLLDITVSQRLTAHRRAKP